MDSRSFLRTDFTIILDNAHWFIKMKGGNGQTSNTTTSHNKYRRGLEGRDDLVVGIPILMGGIVSILPEGFFQAFLSGVHALLKNGLVVGIVLVLGLEHLFLRRRK